MDFSKSTECKTLDTHRAHGSASEDGCRADNISDRINVIKDDINRNLTRFSQNYAYHPACDEFMEEVKNILLSSDAKRVRGIIPVLIGESLDLDREDCMMYGAAIELLHFTSLVHDDVIDGHQYRRGNPSLNNTFADNHAVLIGDYMMCEVINYGLRSAHSSKVIHLMVQAVQNLVAGLILEQNAMPLDASFENYTEMVRLKTGSLFRLAFSLPFIGDDRFSKAMDCGDIFGFLFQVYDDFLDRNQDRRYENLFQLMSRKEISQIWDEHYTRLKAASRDIGIEAVTTEMEQYLRANGYFLTIWDN